MNEDDKIAEFPEKILGYGGVGGNMEDRIRALENDLSFLKGKIGDMPTKDWMTTRLIAVVGGFAGITVLVQYLLTT